MQVPLDGTARPPALALYQFNLSSALKEGRGATDAQTVAHEVLWRQANSTRCLLQERLHLRPLQDTAIGPPKKWFQSISMGLDEPRRPGLLHA